MSDPSVCMLPPVIDVQAYTHRYATMKIWKGTSGTTEVSPRKAKATTSSVKPGTRVAFRPQWSMMYPDERLIGIAIAVVAVTNNAIAWGPRSYAYAPYRLSCPVKTGPRVNEAKKPAMK